MPRKRTKAAKQAQALLVWLEGLKLPARVLNALRRDLEVVTGEREGEEGTSVLAGFDQAHFVEELYQKRGGQIGKVPSVAASAIETLRAAIPSPVSGDPIEAAPTAEGNDTPAVGAAPESGEAAQPVEGGKALADAAQKSTEAVEDDEPAREGIEVMQEALPEVADVALADAHDEQPADAAPVAPLEATDVPAAPKRRGRPPRATAASEVAAGLPPRTRRARIAAARDAAQQVPVVVPPVPAPAPAPATPVTPAVVDPSFMVLLRLWHELHPQGQRAAMHYMASLVAEA